MAEIVSGQGSLRRDWADLSDEELVRRIRAGETGLFEALMRRYNQRLYRIARGILRDDAEAEDVMQHAYVEGYLHLHQFAGRSLFSTWLTKIAVHEALGRVRRRSRQAMSRSESFEDAMSTLESTSPNPEQQALQREARDLLESAIDALPSSYRLVFLLREVEGASTVETAECLGLNAEVVKTRLHRARAFLRKSLLSRAGIATPSAFSLHLSRCDRVVATVMERLRSAEGVKGH